MSTVESSNQLIGNVTNDVLIVFKAHLEAPSYGFGIKGVTNLSLLKVEVFGWY
jgi:hypothetical protein